MCGVVLLNKDGLCVVVSGVHCIDQAGQVTTLLL